MPLRLQREKVWPKDRFLVSARINENYVRANVDSEYWQAAGAAECVTAASGDKEICNDLLQTEHNNFITMACTACNMKYKGPGKGALSQPARNNRKVGQAWANETENIAAVANQLMCVFSDHAMNECFKSFAAKPLHAHAAERVMAMLKARYDSPMDPADDRPQGCVARLFRKIVNTRRRNCITRSDKTHKTRLQFDDPFGPEGVKKDRRNAEVARHQRLDKDNGNVLAHSRAAKGKYYYIGFHSTSVLDSGSTADVITWGQVI